MYATAHVVHADEEEGINAFLHHHGPGFAWPAEASRLPETNPGQIVAQQVDLPPGRNRVRAYLDVLAPDDTSWSELAATLAALEQDLCERKNPTVFTHGQVTIRFGVELGLERLREEQLTNLAAALVRLFDRAK